MVDYGFVKEVSKSFEEVCAILPEALKKEGFGILTTIDLKEKFKEKLGVDFSKYKIFGACNPPSAFKGVSAEENIGLLLPCNIIVHDKNGTTVLGMIRPTVTMQSVKNESLMPVALEVEAKLKRVFDSIQ
jgi:uncharacterized protein (DUF302 family)